MRMFLRAVLAFSAVCLLQAVGFAATLMVAGAGMFSGGAPTTTFSKPNTAWSFSFTVPSAPTVTNADTDGFDVPFGNFTYTLGGTNVVTTPARIRFFCGLPLAFNCTTNFGGLPNINFVDTTSPPDGNPVTGFEFSGATQSFSGSTNNPTILPGSYPTTSASFFSGGSQADFFSGVTINITQTGTPEPATLAMVAGACSLFAWMRRRKSVR